MFIVTLKLARCEIQGLPRLMRFLWQPKNCERLYEIKTCCLPPNAKIKGF